MLYPGKRWDIPAGLHATRLAASDEHKPQAHSRPSRLLRSPEGSRHSEASLSHWQRRHARDGSEEGTGGACWANTSAALQLVPVFVLLPFCLIQIENPAPRQPPRSMDLELAGHKRSCWTVLLPKTASPYRARASPLQAQLPWRRPVHTTFHHSKPR